MKLGDTLGFGSIERDSFTYCGKRITKTEAGDIEISMIPYHQQLVPTMVPRERRRDPSALLNPAEIKKLKGVLGSLQWLVAQLRFDLSFVVSSLQSEKPTVSTLIRANKALTDAKKDYDFTLKFRAVDYHKGGVLVVTDAALGNVTEQGTIEAPVQERVHSQSCYAVTLADAELMQGRKGYFNTIDFRSHRIPRVCRSSYAAETLGAEEGLDVGELVRGFLAECRGLRVDGKDAPFVVCNVPLMGVTDAKDTYDWNAKVIGLHNCLTTSIAAETTDFFPVDSNGQHVCGRWYKADGHYNLEESFDNRRMECRIQPFLCQADFEGEEGSWDGDYTTWT